jgi:hypothetical protein
LQSVESQPTFPRNIPFCSPRISQAKNQREAGSKLFFGSEDGGYMSQNIELFTNMHSVLTPDKRRAHCVGLCSWRCGIYLSFQQNAEMGWIFVPNRELVMED